MPRVHARPRHPFSQAYTKKARAVLDKQAARAYAGFEAHPRCYRLLDAGQLLKHFLAAKRTAISHERKIDLVYVFWEPADARRYTAFALHRDEARRLADQLADEHVRLMPVDYLSLWDSWLTSPSPQLRRHAKALKLRYELKLGRDSPVVSGARTSPTAVDAIEPKCHDK